MSQIQVKHTPADASLNCDLHEQRRGERHADVRPTGPILIVHRAHCDEARVGHGQYHPDGVSPKPRVPLPGQGPTPPTEFGEPARAISGSFVSLVDPRLEEYVCRVVHKSCAQAGHVPQEALAEHFIHEVAVDGAADEVRHRSGHRVVLRAGGGVLAEGHQDLLERHELRGEQPVTVEGHDARPDVELPRGQLARIAGVEVRKAIRRDVPNV
mmetsp:Transcript_36897/g.111521  ORF Transcript_36897/g.111521 Transcript_36897/m.111521 type:complete len:212 (-) Transcript_36897:453-1088(-)